jgi:hypothetical protein
MMTMMMTIITSTMVITTTGRIDPTIDLSTDQGEA